MILVKSTLGMLEETAQYLANGDRAELNKNVAGRDPLMVLAASLGPTSMSIIHNGRVLASGGSRDCLWFVTTRWVEELTPRERMELLGLLKEHLELCRATMLKEHLSNFVWVGNELHIKLLTHLGATFAESTVVSPAGFPFRQFWL